MSGHTMDERVTNLERLAENLAPIPREMGKLTDRVSNVERRLENVEGRLENVEGRLGTVESQIVQLRTDMTDGFSAIRGEMADMKHELREDIAAQRRETAAGFLRLEGELRSVHLKLDRLLLRG